MTNMLHNQKILSRPHTIVIGAVLGTFSGWVMWHEAKIGYARIRKEEIYFKKLKEEYLNNNQSSSF